MGETRLVDDAWRKEVCVWREVHGGNIMEMYGGWCIVEVKGVAEVHGGSMVEMQIGVHGERSMVEGGSALLGNGYFVVRECIWIKWKVWCTWSNNFCFRVC